MLDSSVNHDFKEGIVDVQACVLLLLFTLSHDALLSASIFSMFRCCFLLYFTSLYQVLMSYGLELYVIG